MLGLFCADSPFWKCNAGAEPGFSFGGGGGGVGAAKDYVPARTLYERGTELTFGRGPIKGPGSSIGLF